MFKHRKHKLGEKFSKPRPSYLVHRKRPRWSHGGRNAAISSYRSNLRRYSPVFCSASDANGHITPQHLCIPHREALVSPSKNGLKKFQHTKTHCVCIPADRNMVLCRYLRSYFHRKKCREQLFNGQLCTTIPIRSTRRHRSIKPDHVDRQTYARRNPTSILTRPSEKEKSNQKKQPRG